MTMIDLTYTMSIGDVARVLGISTSRVRQLDELQPARAPNGARRYDPQRVAEVLARRGSK